MKTNNISYIVENQKFMELYICSFNFTAAL